MLKQGKEREGEGGGREGGRERINSQLKIQTLVGNRIFLSFINCQVCIIECALQISCSISCSFTHAMTRDRFLKVTNKNNKIEMNTSLIRNIVTFFVRINLRPTVGIINR